MQAVFKIKDRSSPDRLHKTYVAASCLAPPDHRARARRSVEKAANRLGNVVLGRLASALLLWTSSPLFAGTTTVELSQSIYRSTFIASVDTNKQIGVVLALPSSDPVGLAAFVKHVSTPGDPLYRQYITAAQFSERFGGSASDYQAIKDWAVANGLSASQESITHTVITVRGSTATFERLFQTRINTYRAADGQTFYSAGIAPTVPAEIASRVSAVIGLTSGPALASHAKVAKTLGANPAPHSALMRADSAGGTGPGGTYSCEDLRKAYQTPVIGNLEQGVIVGLFEQGYYKPSDVEVYFKKFGIGKGTKQTPISVDGSPIAWEAAVETEACLDIDMLVGMNPYIAEVKVYIDDYQYDPFSVAMVDAFQAMADDANPPQVISVSYGQDEGLFGASAEKAEDTVLQQLASEGISVFASSGDNGAYGNQYYHPYNVSCPSSDPYVTGVGGTTLFTQPDGGYLSESAWNEFPHFGATGGGVSVFWANPDYQANMPGSYMTQDGGSATYRNVPDVGAIADPLTGVGIYVEGGWIQIGGTSVACPVWAGYMSTINVALNLAHMNKVGFFNPLLYGLVRNGIGHNQVALQPVDTGSNGSVIWFGTPGYQNGGAYNNTTGNGSIWGSTFATLILTAGQQAGAAPGSFNVKTVLPTATTCKIVWSPSSNAGGYIVWVHPLEGLTPTPTIWAHVISADQTSLNVTGLKPNTNYAGWVWAYNASGSNLINEFWGIPQFFFTTPK